MPAAANINEAIQFAATDIAEVSYVNPPARSLLVQMNAWIAGMFSEATGIFKPSINDDKSPGQRPVTDWFGQHLIAKSKIEGAAVGAAGVVGTSAVIDAVVRVLSAVKFATVAGNITAGQQTAVVTLYNTVWA